MWGVKHATRSRDRDELRRAAPTIVQQHRPGNTTTATAFCVCVQGWRFHSLRTPPRPPDNVPPRVRQKAEALLLGNTGRPARGGPTLNLRKSRPILPVSVKKPKPPPLSTFDVFKLASKALWLTTVEPPNELDAIK